MSRVLYDIVTNCELNMRISVYEYISLYYTDTRSSPPCCPAVSAFECRCRFVTRTASHTHSHLLFLCLPRELSPSPCSEL